MFSPRSAVKRMRPVQAHTGILKANENEKIIMDRSRGGQGIQIRPLENDKIIKGFLSNTGPDPRNNHKAIKMGLHRHASKMQFK